jgi:hypothetical protein
MGSMFFVPTPEQVGLTYIPYRRSYHTLLVHLTGFVHNLNLGLRSSEEDNVSEACELVIYLGPHW